MTYDDIADLLIEITVADPRIRAIWIESDARARLRRPYPSLEVHFAADEPVFPALVADIERLLGEHLRVESRGVTDTRRYAKQLDLLVGPKQAAQGPQVPQARRSPQPSGAELPLTLIVEQSCYLAKRPRAWVVPLHDKTGHLYHVMDFSARAGT
jgi:hypothetical protein